jgi:hypothetical protein
VKLETTMLFCELLCGSEALRSVRPKQKSETQTTRIMKPHISLITLGVADLVRSTAFYRDGLGLPLEGDFEGVAFFKLHGTWLSLFPRMSWSKMLTRVLNRVLRADSLISHWRTMSLRKRMSSLCCIRHKRLVRGFSNRRRMPSGEAITVTLLTRMVLCGKLPGTLTSI